MKRLLIFLCSALLIVSCGNSVSHFSSQLEEMEKASQTKDGSEDDWEKLQLEYENFIRDFREHPENYSEEEKAEINKIMGRYHGLLVKEGLNEMAKEVEEYTKHLDSFLEGFFDAFIESDETAE